MQYPTMRQRARAQCKGRNLCKAGARKVCSGKEGLGQLPHGLRVGLMASWLLLVANALGKPREHLPLKHGFLTYLPGALDASTGLLEHPKSEFFCFPDAPNPQASRHALQPT